MKVVRLSALRSGRLYPHGRFLVLISFGRWVDSRPFVQPEGLSEWKISKTLSGIELVTFRLLAQCLKQLAKFRSNKRSFPFFKSQLRKGICLPFGQCTFFDFRLIIWVVLVSQRSNLRKKWCRHQELSGLWNVHRVENGIKLHDIWILAAVNILDQITQCHSSYCHHSTAETL
jgi:hypothetical protein